MVKFQTDIKPKFPAFNESLNGWAYLDNASTTQKPESVIESIRNNYWEGSANIHRGLYERSVETTQQFEGARKKAQQFIGAHQPDEIAFTSGTTESINVVANSFSEILQGGDEVIVSIMEHHANFIPWQVACQKKKANLIVAPLNQSGDLDLRRFKELINNRTRLIAVTHLSNVLGAINPISEIVELAHKKNIPVLVDAAQSVSHLPMNVLNPEVDFLAFSAHKMFGPLGTGILYAHRKHHFMIRPLIFGGGAVRRVQKEFTTFRDFPYCVEAGTPNIPGVIGLGAAIDFINSVGIVAIGKQVDDLTEYAKVALDKLNFVKRIALPVHGSGIIPFIVDNIHPHDVASYLASHKIAVRAGHHCSQPLHEYLNIPASVRVSLTIYNSKEEIDYLVDVLNKLKNFWQ